MSEIKTVILPNQLYFTLEEACQFKGINKKTCYNHKYLMPNFGVADDYIGGRKKWRRQTIEQWLLLSDDVLLSQYTEANDGSK